MIMIPSTAIKDDGNDAMNINHHYKDDSGENEEKDDDEIVTLHCLLGEGF